MQLKFADDSILEIIRMSKNYNFTSNLTTLNIELESTTMNELKDKDFSYFSLIRKGLQDIIFEDYVAINITENYDPRINSISVSLIDRPAGIEE